MLIPVILCGGAGTRLWPVSREAHPKPFMLLDDGQSLLQKSLSRAARLPGVEKVLTVSNRAFYFQTEDHYQSAGAPAVELGYLLEPCGRNTAPAVIAAAQEVVRRWGPAHTLLVLTADHIIQDEAAFSRAVAEAERLAEAGFLVTFGISPSRPETGFGYIEREGETPLGTDSWRIRRFVEKPSREVAEGYLASGQFSWNSGMFCFRAGEVLAEFRALDPALVAAVADCRDHSKELPRVGQGFVVELEESRFAQVRDISIDYALMEKTGKGAVVCCDIGWSDIGSWNAVGDLFPSDDRGNVAGGEVLLHDVRNTYVRAANRVVGVVGVENLVIVDTDDALLVAHRDRCQEVKQIAAQLKAAGHEAYRLHRQVHRPWGTYTVLEEGPSFKIKRIEVRPGASLSLQMHHHRSEHWVVVSGQALVINGEREIAVGTNESTFIPAGHKHRLTNPGSEPCVMIEVQSGSYVGEDDIVRFEDVYGRPTEGR